MRHLAWLLLLLTGCATTVRDLPVDRAPRPEKALLAGRLEFAGTRVDAALRLASLEGHEVVVRPRAQTFLVEVPPGTYEVERFGEYRPAHDRLTFDAEAGRARYIGTFAPVRGRDGDLQMVVRDDPGPVRVELTERYGAAAPALEPGVVASALPPVGGEDLVVALRYVAPPSPSHHFAFGFGYAYHGYYPYRHHHHRHHRRRHR